MDYHDTTKSNIEYSSFIVMCTIQYEIDTFDMRFGTCHRISSVMWTQSLYRVSHKLKDGYRLRTPIRGFLHNLLVCTVANDPNSPNIILTNISPNYRIVLGIKTCNIRSGSADKIIIIIVVLAVSFVWPGTRGRLSRVIDTTSAIKKKRV